MAPILTFRPTDITVTFWLNGVRSIDFGTNDVAYMPEKPGAKP